MAAQTHACPTDCGALVRADHLLCRACWAAVPPDLQRQLLRAWRAWQSPRNIPCALGSYRRARDLAVVAARLAASPAVSPLFVAAVPVPWPWVLLRTAVRVIPCELACPVAPEAERPYVALLQRDIDPRTLRWLKDLGEAPDTAQGVITAVARLTRAEESTQEGILQGQPAWWLQDVVPLPQPVPARGRWLRTEFFCPDAPLLAQIREQFKAGQAELAQASRLDYDWSNQ